MFGVLVFVFLYAVNYFAHAIVMEMFTIYLHIKLCTKIMNAFDFILSGNSQLSCCFLWFLSGLSISLSLSFSFFLLLSNSIHLGVHVDVFVNVYICMEYICNANAWRQHWINYSFQKCLYFNILCVRVPSKENERSVCLCVCVYVWLFWSSGRAWTQ